MAASSRAGTPFCADDVAGTWPSSSGSGRLSFPGRSAPLEVVCTVSEEGLLGSRYLDYETASVGFVLDAPNPSGPSSIRLPPSSSSMAVIARACSRRSRGGYQCHQVAAKASQASFGRVDGATTANIGKFKGDGNRHRLRSGQIGDRSLDRTGRKNSREFSQTFTSCRLLRRGGQA